MLIKEVNGKFPQIPDDCYVAENATIVGDVSFGSNCSVWFNAVVRGDVNTISIGNKVNIQDGAVVHCTYLKHPTVFGNNVSIGHNAIVHGCTIKDNVFELKFVFYLLNTIDLSGFTKNIPDGWQVLLMTERW